jgi:outer membrane protein
MTRLSDCPRQRRIRRHLRIGSIGLVVLFIPLCFNSEGWSQATLSAPAPALPTVDYRSASRVGWFFSAYKSPVVAPSRSQDSDLVSSLIRDGKLTLTLQDAIELAIENNFDVETQRYDRAFADTDMVRAKGGGQLRGVPTTVSELPSGEGGPGEPLLTTVGGYSPVLQLPSSAADLATITETQSDLSVLSATPFSAGPAIPQLDPSVTANISLTQLNYPQPDAFSTGSNYFSSHSLSGGVSYARAFSTGTLLTAAFTSNRVNEASTRFNLNPFTSGALNVTITQPLLQGFGVEVNRRFIKIANHEGRIADEAFAQQLIATISDTTRLYWDLVSLQQDLQVKRESLEAAERLYKDTSNEVEIGAQAPVDLTSALAQVASNRQALINADGMVLQQELLLKETLTRKGISEHALADATIEAVTPIASPDSEPLERLSTLLDTAMTQRPDLALAIEQEEDTRLVLKGSRNALLPQLSLVGSMQNNGGTGSLNPSSASVPGDTNTAAPSTLTGDYGAMLSQVFNRDFPDYSVGAQLNIPIHNRIARADAARDELQYRQSQVRIQQLRSQVRLQVGNALIAVRQAEESYKAAVEARTLQEQALDVERAKFEAGVATAYEILQYQSYMAEAKSAVITALGVYAKAKTALQRAVGSTLVDNHVTLENAVSNRSSQIAIPLRDESNQPRER